jgi:hypothetical protein
MIPNENIVATNLTVKNNKSKLITISRVSKKQETIERHIQIFEIIAVFSCVKTENGIKLHKCKLIP